MTNQIQDRDPPEYHLSQVNQQIRDMMNAVLRRHNLKLVEWRVLQCLADEGTLSVCELSTLAVLERTATGRLVDRLVDRGLVIKEQMPNDRRFARISLHADGLQQLNNCEAQVKEARDRLFSGLSQSDLQQFLNTLLVLQRNMADGAPSGTASFDLAIARDG